MVIMILYEFHLKDITDFNALIDNKTFFDQPVKKKTKQNNNNKKQEAYEKFIGLLQSQEMMIIHQEID